VVSIFKVLIEFAISTIWFLKFNKNICDEEGFKVLSGAFYDLRLTLSQSYAIEAYFCSVRIRNISVWSLWYLLLKIWKYGSGSYSFLRGH
jgi:hypothetical protein